MHLVLYMSSTIPPPYYLSRRTPIYSLSNDSFNEVMYLLWLLERSGIHTEVIDTSNTSYEKLMEAYKQAQIPAILRRVEIRRVFGTKHESGFRFGKEVPALLVYDDSGECPIDIYPHRQKQGDSKMRFDVTIAEYLRKILAQEYAGTSWVIWVIGHECKVTLGHDERGYPLEYKPKRRRKVKQ